MPNAYMGRILFVDLDQRTCTDEKIPESVYERYLSGMGLGAWVLYDRIPAGADPLGPDNVLGFVSGLLTGTGSFFTGRWMVVGKSPVTNGWGDANCGGHLSPAIKRCGYDGVFFRGISDKPTYLLVADGKAELKDASHLWGKDTVETEEMLKEEAGKRAQVACIGPAGEKLSLISGISNDRGRMAARSGLGAVMGSKRLKAIVLSGKSKVEVADKLRMKELSAHCNGFVKRKLPLPPGGLTPWLGTLMGKLPVQMAQDGLLYVGMLKKWGTVSMNQTSIEMGDSPLKNWKGTASEFDRKRSASVNPDRVIAREEKKYFCFSCPLGCGGICKGSGGYKETHKPEYETVLSLGGLLMNEDLDSIFYLNELLNRAGMDTISAGSSVAFALECFENGLLTEEDTDGLKLTWGNTRAIVKLIEKMVMREGIGDLLADGSKRAAEKLGKNSIQYSMNAGGQDLPMHDSRLDPGHAVHYSGDPQPGRHTSGSFLFYELYQLWKKVDGLPAPGLLSSKGTKYRADREKALVSAANARYTQLYNGAGLCMFGAFLGAPRIPVFDWLNAATGWKKSPNEYMEIGGRIHTLRQAFNVKQGLDPRTFKVPGRALGRPAQDHGPNKGRSVPLEALVADYWRELGWDEEGKPGPAAMKDLGID